MMVPASAITHDALGLLTEGGAHARGRILDPPCMMVHDSGGHIEPMGSRGAVR
jgi:hypothetical protein